MNINNNFPSIEQMTSQMNSAKKTNLPVKQSEESFASVLDNVVFSKHASERLESRKITLSDEQMDRLNNGVNLARQKGINDSLVMLDNYAFIVNSKSNTVITAVNDSDKKIFTNIDGAVIV